MPRATGVVCSTREELTYEIGAPDPQPEPQRTSLDTCKIN